MKTMTLIIAAAYVLAALAALGFIHAPRRVSPRLARILMIVAFCAQTISCCNEPSHHKRSIRPLLHGAARVTGQTAEPTRATPA